MAEIRPLTGMRGVAAVSVFLSHLHDTLSDYGLALAVPEWSRRLFLNGGPQVDVFFVLSGYILALNYQNWFAESVSRNAYWTFMRRRFARIYPLHFSILLMVIAFVLAALFTGQATSHGLGRFEPAELPAYFLLMQAWGIFIQGPGSWNPQSWSVSIEVLAYLVFPFLILATSRRSATRPWLFVVLAIVVGLGLNAMTSWGLWGFSAISRGLSEFALGCLVMRLHDGKLARWCQRDVGSIIAVAALALCYLLTPTTEFAVAICSVPVLFALSTPSLAGRFFAWQPLFFLGEISYSIYLGHFLFSSIAYRLISLQWMKTGPLQLAAGIVLVVAFVLVLSTICYYAIERPGRTLLSGRRQQATT